MTHPLMFDEADPLLGRVRGTHPRITTRASNHRRFRAKRVVTRGAGGDWRSERRPAT
ncbi:hypothetical protein [Microbacterium paulum]